MRQLNHVAIIPARNGSKGIANKNLRMLGNKTLVRHAIDHALAAEFFKKIIVTTDIPALCEELSSLVSTTLHRRPESLCTDTAQMKDVVIDALSSVEGIDDDDFFWLLQPTSPLRKTSDFIEIKRKLEVTKAKSIMSLERLEQYHPMRMYHLRDGRVYPIAKTNFKNRQELNPTYYRNGCFYVCEVGAFKTHSSFFLYPCEPYVMPKERSVCIDTLEDLEKAKRMYGKL